MTDLSVLIPARNELFLSNTIDDLLKNMRGSSEIICVLDGQWADPPIQDHPRVTLVYHSQSIGQRAATNEAAKLASGKYVLKCDAHCAFDEGFDVKMMADMQDDWTMVPIMRNLHIFDWVCPDGHRRYQGPSGPCKECGKETVRDVVWITKPSPQSKSYCFDSTPHFQYFREFNKRPEGQGDLTETMSLQGSCFMTTREKYFELGMCDESFGSWCSMGIEIALRTWLSGGRVICNQKTFYAHEFRTQGGDFSFPYTLSQRDVEFAKKSVRDLFFTNSWSKQTYPLSWLIEKFKPVPGWHDESGKAVLEQIMEAGALFSRTRLKQFGVAKVSQPVLDGLLDQPLPNISPGIISASADQTKSAPIASFPSQLVSVTTMGSLGGDGTDTSSAQDIFSMADQSQVKGIATDAVIASHMVEDGDVSSTAHRQGANEPCVDESMNILQSSLIVNKSIAVAECASPEPAFPQRVESVNVDSTEDSPDGLVVKSRNCEIIEDSHDSASDAELRSGSERASHRSGPIIPQKGIVFYTDNRLDSHIFNATQKQIKLSANGLDIVSVSLKPIDFGRNIVLNLERGILTMFKQILAGLEASTAIVIFFAEHDILYHESHFQFAPPRKDVFYYNTNVYKIRREDGHAVRVDFCQQTSGLCAYRELLLEHYRKRVERVEREGYSRNMGFEPGTHSFPRGIDNYSAESWESPYPILDIRHDKNLTPNRWSPNQFRNQKFAKGWLEISDIPGWGVTKGRFDEFLRDIEKRAVSL